MLNHVMLSFLNAAIRGQGVSKVVQKASEAIVEIGITETSKDKEKDQDLEEFFGDIKEELLCSNGSGIIISDTGMVVTLAKFIKNKNALIKIRLKTRAEYDATVKYIDQGSELAFLQMSVPNNKKLPFLKLGNSDAIFHGDFIVSIGHLCGLGQSVTGGVISMPTRIFADKILLQTDTSIYPGNAGGAIIDINGNLIGMMRTQKSTSYGIGFGIPSNFIKAIKEESTGRKPASFELDVTNIPVQLRESGIHHGVQVQSAKAPFQYGDVITKINDIPINTTQEFDYRQRLSTAGQAITFRVFRDNKYSNIKIKAKENLEIMQNKSKENWNSEEKSDKNKITIENNSFLKGLEISKTSSGLLILEAPSKCDVILKKDDIIYEVDNKKDNKDIINILESLDNNRSLNISIKRNQDKIHYKIKKLSRNFIFKDSIFAEVEKNNDKKYLMIVYPDINMKEKWKDLPLKGDVFEKIDTNAVKSIDEIGVLETNSVKFVINRDGETTYWEPEFNLQYYPNSPRY